MADTHRPGGKDHLGPHRGAPQTGAHVPRLIPRSPGSREERGEGAAGQRPGEERGEPAPPRR